MATHKALSSSKRIIQEEISREFFLQPLQADSMVTEKEASRSGKTIWNYPGGDFTRGVFCLRSIKYNLAG